MSLKDELADALRALDHERDARKRDVERLQDRLRITEDKLRNYEMTARAVTWFLQQGANLPPMQL